MGGNEVATLAGVTVADLTVTLPGPYATSLLQRLGARVVKIEPPGGDLTRMTPSLHDSINAGKESIELDLKDPGGARLAAELAAAADIVVEGWRPGVAARHGLGPGELLACNPRLVYCSISGYGAHGPLRRRAGHDLNYLAASGMAALLFAEEPPRALPVPLADLAGGTFAALRIVTALLAARTNGEGSFVDVSITGALRDWVEAIGAEESPAAALPLLPHYGVFETADDHHLTLANVQEDHFWAALCGALGLEELAELDLGERMVRREELRVAVSTRVGAMTRDQLSQRLGEVDTCWAFVDPPAQCDASDGMLPASRGATPGLGEHSSALRPGRSEPLLHTGRA